MKSLLFIYSDVYLNECSSHWVGITPLCTLNYWVLGLSPSSGIQKVRKSNVSETGSVSVLR
jgi:hypothetical protein